MDDFAGKTAIVTGAAGALGRAVARRLAQGGARLALFDVAPAPLEQVARGFAGAVPIAADLTDAVAARAAVERARASLGRLDALCNIAGGFRMGPAVHETDDALWRAMHDLNVATMLNATRVAVPIMLAQGGGRIVNIGALSALSGKANMAAYTAAKSTVIRLTESLAAELRGRGIGVNCVLPSIIDTPANRADMPDADFSKWVAPDALADAIAFLASDAARAIHGAALPVVGLS